jgi:hypothetical protein
MLLLLVLLLLLFIKWNNGLEGLAECFMVPESGNEIVSCWFLPEKFVSAFTMQFRAQATHAVLCM